MESTIESVDPEEIMRRLERLIVLLTKKYKVDNEKERKTIA
ncbi:MAG: hypothetical protein AABX53_00480 [Nanoarchaeota archaeon]